jgi:hypothetical protein
MLLILAVRIRFSRCILNVKLVHFLSNCQHVHLKLAMQHEETHLFLLVVMMEDKPEDHGCQGCCNSNTSVHPHDGRVAGRRHQGFADGGPDSVGEEIEGLYERLHTSRRFGVSIFQPGHWDMLAIAHCRSSRRI